MAIFYKLTYFLFGQDKNLKITNYEYFIKKENMDKKVLKYLQEGTIKEGHYGTEKIKTEDVIANVD